MSRKLPGAPSPCYIPAALGRPKTRSDTAVLAIARATFLEQGHAVSTREIARAAGVSEAVLYQRFGSKDALFSMAMVPVAADVEALLGPEQPVGDARAFVRKAVERMTDYFGEVLPIVIQLMTHPLFDMRQFPPQGPTSGRAALESGLSQRLAVLQKQHRIGTTVSSAAAAHLLTSLAHEWALRACLDPSSAAASTLRRDLLRMVDVAWQGLGPTKATIPRKK